MSAIFIGLQGYSWVFPQRGFSLLLFFGGCSWSFRRSFLYIRPCMCVGFYCECFPTHKSRRCRSLYLLGLGVHCGQLSGAHCATRIATTFTRLSIVFIATGLG